MTKTSEKLARYASKARSVDGAKRTERIMFPVSAEERNAIRARATTAQSSLSEYCRTMLLKK